MNNIVFQNANKHNNKYLIPHFPLFVLYKIPLQEIEYIARKGYSRNAYGDKQGKEPGLYRLSEHYKRRQGKGRDRHHEGEHHAQQRAFGQKGLG